MDQYHPPELVSVVKWSKSGALTDTNKVHHWIVIFEGSGLQQWFSSHRWQMIEFNLVYGCSLLAKGNLLPRSSSPKHIVYLYSHAEKRANSLLLLAWGQLFSWKRKLCWFCNFFSADAAGIHSWVLRSLAIASRSYHNCEILLDLGLLPVISELLKVSNCYATTLLQYQQDQ